ncbi:MAG: 3-deoxy-D-manno-octulosonic acid transferase [Desulfobulbus sp.]|nr:3-deoxy-D-manno-octulosonic acid transferase [Desulfobulbus sp.]
MPIFQLLYTLLSSLLLLCALPLLPWVAGKNKYRSRILRRVGVGLKAQLDFPHRTPQKKTTIWIHALSVGEVTSALPLIRGLRQQLPQAVLIFSATTRSGSEVANSLLASLVDAIIPAPLDLGPVVPYYLDCIRPDLFIQVETDFWPHWLFCLRQRQIPLMLVNGRISARSFHRYQRFPWLFRPMFTAFTLLAMQTQNDADKMRKLGLPQDKVLILGNLKFDTQDEHLASRPDSISITLRHKYGFSAIDPLWICGSTHPGEEEILLGIYSRLHAQHPGLQLMLAPRNIERTDGIMDLTRQMHLPSRRRTKAPNAQGPLLVLDTIGELAGCYAMADIAFVGGSLLSFGGHNPLEPAGAGVPVLVGPYIEDFSEITQGLVDAGGVFRVGNKEALEHRLSQLLANPVERQAMGTRAAAWIGAHRGVVVNHLTMIDQLLAGVQPGT